MRDEISQMKFKLVRWNFCQMRDEIFTGQMKFLLTEHFFVNGRLFCQMKFFVRWTLNEQIKCHGRRLTATPVESAGTEQTVEFIEASAVEIHCMLLRPSSRVCCSIIQFDSEFCQLILLLEIVASTYRIPSCQRYLWDVLCVLVRKLCSRKEIWYSFTVNVSLEIYQLHGDHYANRLQTRRFSTVRSAQTWRGRYWSTGMVWSFTLREMTSVHHRMNRSNW